MKRDKRLEIIKEIVTNNKISTQEELQSLLLERGVEVTQATLSRDIRKLNIIKIQLQIRINFGIARSQK